MARSLAALGGRTWSELVEGMASGAKVVKAISNMPMRWIADFRAGEPVLVMFLAGNDADAKGVVGTLLDSVGFTVLVLGSLGAGGRLFQLGGPFSAIELRVGRRLTRS